jgi:hypothetical protein
VIVARFERAGIQEVLDRHPGFEVELPPRRPSAPPKPPQGPPGPPRFAVGRVQRLDDPDGHLAGGDVDDAVARHAAGDWGDCLHVEDNERALATKRPLMSIFRTPKGTRYVIITSGGHGLTTVLPYETHQDVDPVLLVDAVCAYAGTGKEPEPVELEPGTESGTYYCPALLIGSGRNPGDDEHGAATRLLEQMIRTTGNIPFRFEQTVWALWNVVYGVDLRPFGANGQRIAPEADDATWFAAAERCAEQGLRAWFSVRWEQRLDA